MWTKLFYSCLQKYYFYDVGIRNALINTFSTNIENRTDLGSLWENFIISEKVKQNYNKNSAYKYFFWRTKSGSEVDLVEEQNMNTIEAFEIKFSKEKSTNKKAFQTEFPHANLQVINKENYTKFL